MSLEDLGGSKYQTDFRRYTTFFTFPNLRGSDYLFYFFQKSSLGDIASENVNFGPTATNGTSFDAKSNALSNAAIQNSLSITVLELFGNKREITILVMHSNPVLRY